MKVFFFIFFLIFGFGSNTHLSFLSKIDTLQNEDSDYSPFSPSSSLETKENLADIDPVDKSLQISAMTNQFTNVQTETKKPIVKDFPQDNRNYIEIRKNFKEPASMHINYYINSV